MKAPMTDHTWFIRNVRRPSLKRRAFGLGGVSSRHFKLMFKLGWRWATVVAGCRFACWAALC